MPGSLSEIPLMVIEGSIISAVSLLIIGFSTAYWFRFEPVHMGLWKYCGEDTHFKGSTYCLELIDCLGHANQLTAAQVLECVALLAFFAAVTCAFLKMFVLKELRMLFLVSGLLNWLADGLGHSNQLIAAQVLECFALLAFIAAVTCAFLKMFVLKEQGMLFLVSGLLNWLAGALALVGVIVYATMSFGGSKLGYSHFHFSFGICIVGGIGGVFSGIVFLLAWRWIRN